MRRFTLRSRSSTVYAREHGDFNVNTRRDAAVKLRTWMFDNETLIFLAGVLTVVFVLAGELGQGLQITVEVLR